MNVPDLVKLFQERTGRRGLANITHIGTIPSIMQRGILCHEQARKFKHQSIALESVQDRRDMKRVPNGLRLHQYASLYFSPRNPMMYYRSRNTGEAPMQDLCILSVSPEVLNLDGVVVSDGNAASEITRFFAPEEGLLFLDFNKVYAEWWNAEDSFEKDERKRIKCAEVLIPYAIPYSFITGVVVPYESTAERMRVLGFDKRIGIYPNQFFLEGGE